MKTAAKAIPMTLLLAMFAALILNASAMAQTDATDKRAVQHYNIGKKGQKPALQGYDPVAYFKEGGGKATKGKKDFELRHEGVTYRFSSQANLDRFRNNPDRYEPAYGGWCAYAMAQGKGDKVSINPKFFVVDEGRLYVFFKSTFNNTRSKWNKKPAELEKKADANWKTITGETPRNSKLTRP